MLLALVLALSNAPKVEPLEVSVTVGSRPVPAQTTLGVRSEGGEEQLFEVELEEGQGTIQVLPTGPPPYDLRIVDERLVDLKQPPVHSGPVTIGTIGGAAAQFMVKHSAGGRIDDGYLHWVRGDERHEILKGEIPITVRELGLLSSEGAYLEVGVEGGIPVRLELQSSTRPGQMPMVLLPERTVVVQVVDDTGVPMSGVECVMTPVAYHGLETVRPTDGEGRVSFGGVAGQNQLKVLFGDHFRVRRSIEIDADEDGDLLIARPPSGQLQFDLMSLPQSVVDALEVSVGGEAVGNLVDPIHLGAGWATFWVHYSDVSDFDVVHSNTSVEDILESVEIRPGETTVVPLDVSALPSRLELEVIVNGEPVSIYSARFEGGPVIITFAEVSDTVFLGAGTFNVTVMAPDESWKREFRVEASGGEILRRRIEVETKD